MRRATILALFTACLCIGIFTTRAAAQPAQFQQPSVTRLELARWDVMLNDIGLDAIKQNPGQPAKAEGSTYQATMYDASALRAAIAQAKATSGQTGAGNLAMAQQIGDGTMQIFQINFVSE